MPTPTKSADQAPLNPGNFQKWVLLILSLVFLGFGILLETTSVLEIESSEFVAGTLLKVGFVLGITWLAFPHLEQLGWDRIRGTLGLGIVLVLILLAIRPRIGAIAASILVAGTIATALLGWVRRFFAPVKRRRRT